MAELVCCQCGYSLEGLAPEGVCPECARAIAESVRVHRLRPALGRFYGRVRLGCLMTGWASVALGALLLIPGNGALWMPFLLNLLVQFAVCLTGLAGWWVLAAHPLERVEELASARRWMGLRTAVRWLAAGALVVTVFLEAMLLNLPMAESVGVLGMLLLLILVPVLWGIGFLWLAMVVGRRAPALGVLCRIGVVFVPACVLLAIFGPGVAGVLGSSLLLAYTGAVMLLLGRRTGEWKRNAAAG
jgi:hypothetical protein